MKLEQGGVHPSNAIRPGRRREAGGGSLPVEWMDPMSWRLPSGKALAEFALQAGFIAPLLFTGPGLGGIRRAPERRTWKAGNKSGRVPAGSRDLLSAEWRREA